MEVSLTFKNLESNEGMKDYVERKVQKLKRLLKEPIEVKVVFSSEKFLYHVDLSVNDGEGINAKARETQGDLQSAFDLVLDKVERQIKDQKSKLQSKGKEVRVHTVVEVHPSLKLSWGEPYPLKPMALEEALRELEGRDEDFLAFINEETGKVNLIYRKKKGGYGIIELEG